MYLFKLFGRGNGSCNWNCRSLRPLSTSMFAQDASTLATWPGALFNMHSTGSTLSKFRLSHAYTHYSHLGRSGGWPRREGV